MSDTRGPDFEAVEDQILPETPDPSAQEVPAEATRRRARLLPMWILIAAVVIVGVAWAMSERNFNEAEVTASVPLVTAEETPVKVRPEESGGVDVPDRDKYVYKSLTDEEPEAEQLLPPPEEPMERPPIEVVEVAASEPAPEVMAEVEDAAMETATGQAPAPPPLDELVVAEVVTPMAEAEFMKEEAAVDEPSVEPSVEMVAAIEEAPKATEPEAAPAPAPEPEISSAAPEQSASLRADSGRFLVQIGAAQNEAAANGEIARLAKKHPNILSLLSGIVIRADLGDKGVWYRMRVGPFATRGDANGVCGQLKAVNVGCFVVAN
ncbi:MAG: SPOR domain-containing protein [Alphaproteobacteria bacterium]